MKRQYEITFSNSGGVLDRRTFEADDDDDMQDAGAAASEIAIEMIREAGSLYPGDCIRLMEHDQ